MWGGRYLQLYILLRGESLNSKHSLGANWQVLKSYMFIKERKLVLELLKVVKVKVEVKVKVKVTMKKFRKSFLLPEWLDDL